VRRIVFSPKTLFVTVASVALLGGGCATPDAPDLRGRWRPLNQFADTPHAIPLQQAYVYQASPADGTLKALLGRWAKDAKITLSYQHPNDYTLHAPVAHIRTTSLQQAATALSAAYAAQGVRVDAQRSEIIVSQVRADAQAGGAVDGTGG